MRPAPPSVVWFHRRFRRRPPAFPADLSRRRPPDPARSPRAGRRGCAAAGRRRPRPPVAAGPLGTGVGLQQGPERRAVVRHQQVRQLVQQHVVQHVLRHALEPVGEADRALARGAGAPARVLVGDPADLAGVGAVVQVRGRQLAGPRHQGLVPGDPPGLLGGELLQHLRDPALLLGVRHPGRDQHDGAVTLAVGGDGATAAGAAPHLDPAAVVRLRGDDPRGRVLRRRRPRLLVLVRAPARARRRHL